MTVEIFFFWGGGDFFQMLTNFYFISFFSGMQMDSSTHPKADWSTMPTTTEEDSEKELPETPFNAELSDLDFGNDTFFMNIDENDAMTTKPLIITNIKPCPHETSIHNELLHEHEMMSRLTKALFALKIGSFRDIMLGPHLMTGLGNV